MSNRQTAIVSIFVLFAALLTLSGCKDNKKEIIGLARSNRPKTKNILTQRADGWFFRNVNIHFMAMLLL